MAAVAITLFAVPALADDEGTITFPTSGATVSGSVEVHGTAAHPTFRKWQADLILDGDPSRATFLALGESPVTNGDLFTWDTTLYPNGKHTLRLRVVHSNLNYEETFVPVTIANAAAPAPEEKPEPDDETKPDAATEEKAKPEPAPVVFRTDAPAEGKRWIAIDISDQSLTAWQGDVPVFETTVSTGKPGFRTLPGTFAVYRKYEETRMRGIDYDTPDVPWTMYYDGSFAIHGAYWHDNFGTPVSHGCVNLRVPEAKALFEWADVGTEVVVTQ
ncbi:MAG: L,D-transpeptidase family protein [Caldilineaceae bacterium]|nr:L,D-transpeptidase family protein [Caldilineaceae bacterium]